MDNHGSATPAPGYEEHAGLTLAEAAISIGISKDAVRRRLKAGKLAGHQVVGAHGPEWCVHPEQPGDDRHGGATPAHTPAPPLDNPGATVAQPADVAALVAIVDRLERENGELKTAVAAWQSQAVVLAGRLSDAQDRLAIAAPPVTPQEPILAAQTAPAPVESPVTVSRPWWPLVSNDTRQTLAVVLLVTVLLAVSMFAVWPR